MDFPKHIAIIMDGNGRWAKQRGLPRIAGHREGMKAVKRIVKFAVNLGIKTLTLYAFSTENWKRPKDEVSGLMNLFCEYIKKEIDEVISNNIKMCVSGDIEHLPKKMLSLLNHAIEKTKKNNGLILNIALNYGGRDEIVRVTKRIVEKAIIGDIALNEIDENLFSSFLDTYPLPDPDLLIRTSGETRISNFLLWQIAYTEIWITSVLWPDFSEEHLLEAVEDYKLRKRKFGGV
ncbi:TPA: isoprenyl transferase [bacterium]|nr:isoprenyl transferase [bacterium]